VVRIGRSVSADLRQQALARGREYSNLTRSQKGVTIYDEMAVMNDIGAATAGATTLAATPAPAPVVASTTSVEDRIKRLDELRTKGIVNDQEYEERRRKILDEL
jgi:Short C-terminal domain